MTTLTETRAIPNEDSWNLWFTCLPPWDQSTVLRHELQWHDGYIDGSFSFATLRTMIDRAQGLRPGPQTV